VSWALPLAIVKLPDLRFTQLKKWLVDQRVTVALQGRDRLLHACLIARNGRGIVLLDGTDADDDRRFSLAHETAHFLLDYLKPRKDAVARLGTAGGDILDGKRLPTIDERLTGLFSGLELKAHVHLLERSADGQIERQRELEAEDRADRLALELLAPRRLVLQLLEADKVRWTDASALKLAEKALMAQFGLPVPVAVNYARFLVAGRRGSSTFREWLGS
jgi:hypothetical protein